MDAFRREQKKQCADAVQRGQRRTYGCSCCRDLSNLNHFKKMSRKLAKRRLKMWDRLRFQEAV